MPPSWPAVSWAPVAAAPCGRPLPRSGHQVRLFKFGARVRQRSLAPRRRTDALRCGAVRPDALHPGPPRYARAAGGHAAGVPRCAHHSTPSSLHPTVPSRPTLALAGGRLAAFRRCPDRRWPPGLTRRATRQRDVGPGERDIALAERSSHTVVIGFARRRWRDKTVNIIEDRNRALDAPDPRARSPTALPSNESRWRIQAVGRYRVPHPDG